jgi:hypothetical protein
MEIPYEEKLVVMTVVNNSQAYKLIKHLMGTNHQRATRTMLWEVINHLSRKKSYYARLAEEWADPRDKAHRLNWELIGAEIMRQLLDNDILFKQEVARYNKKQIEYNRKPLHWVWPSMPSETKLDYGPTVDFDSIEIENKTLEYLTGESPMNDNTPTYETKHLVNGRDVNEMTDHELISAIRKLEKEIESLSNIKTESKVIGKKIAEAEKGIKFIVKHLDKRA